MNKKHKHFNSFVHLTVEQDLTLFNIAKDLLEIDFQIGKHYHQNKIKTT